MQIKGSSQACIPLAGLQRRAGHVRPPSSGRKWLCGARMKVSGFLGTRLRLGEVNLAALNGRCEVRRWVEVQKGWFWIGRRTERLIEEEIWIDVVIGHVR